METMERFKGPWDSKFHIRPELTSDEKLDILNNTQNYRYTAQQQQQNNIKEQEEELEIQID